MPDYGYGAFGATRTAQTTLDKFNADPFSILYHPGNLYLTGYGSSSERSVELPDRRAAECVAACLDVRSERALRD